MRFTTWLEQCTLPYIDVMGEKSMTCTSPDWLSERQCGIAQPVLAIITWQKTGITSGVSKQANIVLLLGHKLL